MEKREEFANIKTRIELAKNRLGITLDNMLEGCQIIGRDWRYLYLNSMAASHGKRKKEELLGKTMMEEYPGIEKTEMFARLKRCMEESVPDRMENEFTFPDGKKGWFELRIKPVLEGILILSLDITTSKMAEIALRESEEKYKILVENIPDVTWIADKNGSVAFISPRIEQISGFTTDEIYKGGFEMTFGQMHPDDLDRARREYDSIFRAEEPIDDVVRFRHKNGDWVWCHMRSLNTYEKNGVQYAVGLLSNVTDKKEAERKIKELDNLKTKFIKVVSHDMRTPLTVIKWSIENLLSGEGKSGIEEPQLSTLRMLQETTKDVIVELEDLLTAMDIKESRISFSTRETSLESLVSSAITSLKNDIETRNIKLAYNRPDSPLPALKVDPEKMLIAISKVLANAIIYTHDHIQVHLENDHDRVRLEVEDNGIGIPEAESKHIFGLFFRASNASLANPNGLGVGLAIAKYFVEQNGGQINFSSKEGSGSKFWIEIPLNTP